MAWPYTAKDPLLIPPGQLRNEITLQAQSQAPDAVTGAPSASWATVMTTMAGIASQGSREVFQAQQYASQVTHVLTVRWPGTGVAIAGGMRVSFGTRTFTVQSVENVMERNRVMKLMCVEVDGVQA